jgi:hypothetical protein
MAMESGYAYFYLPMKRRRYEDRMRLARTILSELQWHKSPLTHVSLETWQITSEEKLSSSFLKLPYALDSTSLVQHSTI